MTVDWAVETCSFVMSQRAQITRQHLLPGPNSGHRAAEEHCCRRLQTEGFLGKCDHKEAEVRDEPEHITADDVFPDIMREEEGGSHLWMVVFLRRSK